MCLNLEIKLVVILQIHKKNETDPEADLSSIVVFLGIPQIGSRIATNPFIRAPRMPRVSKTQVVLRKHDFSVVMHSCAAHATRQQIIMGNSCEATNKSKECTHSDSTPNEQTLIQILPQMNKVGSIAQCSSPRYRGRRIGYYFRNVTFFLLMRSGILFSR